MHHYYGGNLLNRLSWLRQDVAILNKMAVSATARYVLLENLNPLSTTNDAEKSAKLLTVEYEMVKKYLSDPIFSKPEEYNKPVVAEDEDRKPALVFLGVDEGEAQSLPEKPPSGDAHYHPDGAPYFAIDASNLSGLREAAVALNPDTSSFLDLRAGVSRLSMPEAGIASEARSLIDWNKRNRFCSGCGQPTVSVWGGWKRACLPDDAVIKNGAPCISKKGVHNFQYPRTDPVCIMAVLHPTEDKILLGRNKSWPGGFMSCLAGFLEPGESPEEAVTREVWEEAGVKTQNVKYHSAQPWPYPSSLMLGLSATALPDQKIRLDLDNELEQALWVSREDVLSALGRRSEFSRHEVKQLDLGAPEGHDGKVKETINIRLPPSSAIAHVLIAAWANGEITR